MSVPISQMWTVATYVLGQKLRGRRRYPLVLMLEPLFRCNLACAGCGKIQHPADMLRREPHARAVLRGRRAVRRADRLHSRRRTAAASADRRDRRRPGRAQEVRLPLHERHQAGGSRSTASSRRSTWRSRCTWTGRAKSTTRPSAARACTTSPSSAIRAAGSAAFASPPTPRCSSAPIPSVMRRHFDEMMELGVEGMMISPGYPYEKAPDQEHFLHRRADDRTCSADCSTARSERVAIQPVAAVPRVPQRELGTRMHALGQSHVQRLRLAEAVLPAGRRLLRHVPGAARQHRLVELRPRQRQPASAPTAWSTAATSRPPWSTPSARSAAFWPQRGCRFSAPGNRRSRTTSRSPPSSRSPGVSSNSRC